MSRYHFHVTDGRLIPDHEGLDLPSLEDAREEALEASVELLRGLKSTPAFWAGDSWAMNVTDDTGRTVFRLQFSGVEHA